ncbi:MAG: SDR family NAD(P)-dependent oxidoreductase, partial [Eubacteriales bacterium]|nr:SDR family NAD(P)-dependent oxidoreductase [Eubacteriales bacterium]
SGLDTLSTDIAAMGGACRTFSLSASDPDAVAAAMAETYEQYGRIDIMCCCAATGCIESIEDLTHEQINSMIDVNLKGPIFATKAVIPYMKKAGGGNIIMISSMAATRGLPTPPDYNGVYTASKWGLNGFDDCMGKYLMTNYNIRVCTICPGTSNTSIWDGIDNIPYPREKMIPAGYIAKVVAFIIETPESVALKQIQLPAAIEVNNF